MEINSKAIIVWDFHLQFQKWNYLSTKVAVGINTNSTELNFVILHNIPKYEYILWFFKFRTTK